MAERLQLRTSPQHQVIDIDAQFDSVTAYESIEEQSDVKEIPQKVLAFDLLLEHQRIHQPANSDQKMDEVLGVRKERFMENAWTYAKEASGVKVAEYDPYSIEHTAEGIRLCSDAWSGGPVRELFNPDRYDPNVPWPAYRLAGVNYERAKIEYQTFSRFENEQLPTANEGDIFVWVSPPPTDILLSSESDKVKQQKLNDLGYDFHTNTFAFQIKDGTVQGTAIQNYLNPHQHQQFLEWVSQTKLSQTNPTDQDFLKHIMKVNNTSIQSSLDVQRVIQTIYQEVPENERITPPGDKQQTISENEMNELLTKTQPLLEHLYYSLLYTKKTDLSEQATQQFIQERVNTWEKAVNKLKSGEHVDLSAFESMSVADIERFAYQQVQELNRSKTLISHQYGLIYDHPIYSDADSRYARMKLAFDDMNNNVQDTKTFGGTGCGIGSGFGNSALEKILNPLNLVTTYQSATDLLNSENKKWEYHTGDCVMCGGKQIDVGPCNLCKSCEKTFD